MVNQNLLDLPLEILEVSWAYCSRGSMAKFSLCSKKCNYLIAHVLYSKVFVRPSIIKTGVKTIISRGRLKMVKSLSFKDCWPIEEDIWDTTDKCMSIIDACDPVKVTELSISDSSVYGINSKYGSLDLLIFSTALMVNLTSLVLFGKHINISNLAVLSSSRLKCLKKLTLDCCNFPSNGLHHLLGLSDLRIESCTCVTDETFDSISKMVSLKSLILRHNHPLTIPLDKLKELVLLERLDVPDSPVRSETGLATLMEVVHSLKFLDLESSVTFTFSFQIICSLSSLRELNVGKCGISDNHLQLLTKLKHLQVLDIDSNNITDVGLKYVSDLHELRELLLYSNDKITDEGIGSLVSLVLLRFIDIESCDLLTDKSLMYLSTLPSLRTLVILDENYFSSTALEEMKNKKNWLYM